MANFPTVVWLVLGSIVPALTAAQKLNELWSNSQQTPRTRGILLVLLALVGMFALLYAVTGVAMYAFNWRERDNYLKAQRYVKELLDAPGVVEFPPYESFSQVCQEILGLGNRDPNAPSVDFHKASGVTSVWGYVDAKNADGSAERSKWRVVLRRGALQEIEIRPLTGPAAAHKKAPGTKSPVPDA